MDRTVEYKGKRYKRVVSNFSCGAASMVATTLALLKFGAENVDVVYQQTNSEHIDNERFIYECEGLWGVKVTRQQSPKYHDIWEVFNARQYLAGIHGAPCTSELKRKVAESHLDFFNDLEVFGYTNDELGRISNFRTNNPERAICPILADAGLSKNDCYDFLALYGIKLPEMYLLGYRNNNCIGCVKGQMGYWNKIRIDFPDVFNRMSGLEREFNCALNKRYRTYQLASPDEVRHFWNTATDSARQKVEDALLSGDRPLIRIRVFLDELDPRAGRYESEPGISCGTMCESG